MENENKTKHEPSVEAFNLAQRIWNAGKNWNRNDDGLDVPSSARLIDELLEQSPERVSVDAVVMWRPIEEAAFDSGWYLVKEKDDDMHIAIWDDEKGIWTNGYFEVNPVKFIELGILAKLPDAT